MFGVVAARVAQAEAVVLREGVVKPHTPQMLVIATALRLVGHDVVRGTVVERMERGLVGGTVRLAVVVLIVEVDVQLVVMIEEGTTLTPHGLMLLVPRSRELPLPAVGLRGVGGNVEVDARATHLIAGRRGVHHLGVLQPACGQTLQQGIELCGIHLIVFAVDQYIKGIARQRERAIVVSHAGDELERVIDVIRTLLLQQLRHVVGELAAFYLHHRPLALDHHLGQGVDDAVHAQ